MPERWALGHSSQRLQVARPASPSTNLWLSFPGVLWQFNISPLHPRPSPPLSPPWCFPFTAVLIKPGDPSGGLWFPGPDCYFSEVRAACPHTRPVKPTGYRIPSDDCKTVQSNVYRIQTGLTFELYLKSEVLLPFSMLSKLSNLPKYPSITNVKLFSLLGYWINSYSDWNNWTKVEPWVSILIFKHTFPAGHPHPTYEQVWVRCSRRSQSQWYL